MQVPKRSRCSHSLSVGRYSMFSGPQGTEDSERVGVAGALGAASCGEGRWAPSPGGWVLYCFPKSSVWVGLTTRGRDHKSTQFLLCVRAEDRVAPCLDSPCPDSPPRQSLRSHDLLRQWDVRERTSWSGKLVGHRHVCRGPALPRPAPPPLPRVLCPERGRGHRTRVSPGPGRGGRPVQHIL